MVINNLCNNRKFKVIFFWVLVLKRWGGRLYLGRVNSWKIKLDMKSKIYKLVFFRECFGFVEISVINVRKLFNYFFKREKVLINVLCYRNII